MIIFPVYSTLRAASPFSIDSPDIPAPISSRYVIQWVLCSYLYLTSLQRCFAKIYLSTIKQRNDVEILCQFRVCIPLLPLNIATSLVCAFASKRNTIWHRKAGKRKLKKCFSQQDRVIYMSQAFDLILTAISLSLAFSLTEALSVS